MHHWYRSVSEPSIGTLTGISGVSGRVSHQDVQHRMINRTTRTRGQFLFEGRFEKYTMFVLMAPYNVWFQALVLLTVVFKYLSHFLRAYYYREDLLILDVASFFCEVVFVCDVFVHLVHAYWPLVRVYTRVYRRNIILLIFDLISLLSFPLIATKESNCPTLAMIGRWFSIGRIYRVPVFFTDINQNMRASRKFLYIIEHFVLSNLFLHAAACLWFDMHQGSKAAQSWHHLGFPKHVDSKKVEFNTYKTCWYYCACRFYNIIFGDAFPMRYMEKWLSSLLMLVGYVFFRYNFIGKMAWELVLQNSRQSGFVDRYHHMIEYLKIRGAPSKLIEQAKQYKKQVWEMKNGVLVAKQLQKLPVPLQMELIFDINVGHFHNSLLFRDTEEAFMRQISLLMTHELYLAGQYIWSQGVVKNGMICVKQGVLEMLSDEDDESPMIAFSEGTVLGELSLFYSIPSKVTLKAATYVELQVLRRTDLMRVMFEHPVVLEQIREKIGRRLKMSRKRQEAIMKYDKDDSRLIRTRYRPMKVLKDNLAGVEEEDPTFVDDSHMYYKDENNVRQPKFTSEFLELYQMTNNVTTIDMPRICLRSTFPWILEPDTDFTNMFDIAHFIIVLYLCIMSPQFAIKDTLSDTEKALSTIVITGMLLNIYLQLTTAIVYKNVKKVTVREIAEVKMATIGFYLDIVSVFPVHIFTDTLDPQGESVAGQVVKLFPVLQVWHIWDYIMKWERNFYANLKFLNVLKYFLVTVIFSYWCGCVLYIFACPRKLCRKTSWMTHLIYWETKVFTTIEAKHEKPMLTSFSFGTSVFTGSGASELSPSSSDCLLVSFLFIFGSYVSCIYTAKITSIYLLSTWRKLKFKESMRELFYFLSVNHVSHKIKTRVKKFFCVQWYYNKAVSTQSLFKDMSSNIQQEVLSIEMVETLLYCPLFQECNRDFLQTVAANVRTIVLPDNEIVQHAADIGRDMYILQRGHCNLLNHNGKILRSLAPGSHFGVVEMLFGLPKVYTVLTSTNCILLHVEYTALVQCWGTFPDISHPIIKILQDPELVEKTAYYEEARPLIGHLNVKTNRLTQEIKESFVVLSGHEERAHYLKTFETLGVMRYLRYIFVPGVITPHGIFLKLWCTMRFLFAIYYVLAIPYAIAIKQYKYYDDFYLVDIFLYVDIIVMSYVAYYNHKNLLVTHPLLTVSQYLKRAFLLDFLSIFPFEYLVRILNEHANLDLYRVNRILTVTRITGTFSHWESDIMRVNPAVVFLKFLPIAMTLVNVATAFVFANTCVSYLPDESHYIMVNCTKTHTSNIKYDTKCNWVGAMQMGIHSVTDCSTISESVDAVTEYINTFYWVFEVFVGVGCTPVTAVNRINVLLIMLLQIVGLMYFAFMFGYVASTRSATSKALLEHTEKTKDLSNFLYQENVDPVLTSKTLRYFEYVWKRTNGSNPQQICRRLNSALMEDTLVFMYERALREVPLFGKVKRSFIRVITQHLKEMYFLKGDTVIQCRDIHSSVYIIYRGKVDVLTSYNEMITCMGPGGMFGNFTGQSISCSEVTVYASRSLDLLMIPSQTFFNLIKYHPKVQEPLNKAFETSRNYILPINMDLSDDSSSGSDEDMKSLDSAVDSRSNSSRFDGGGQISIRSSQSHSNVSQAKSSVSTLTFHSYLQVSNLLRPGTFLYQGFGYFTCVMAVVNYALVLYEVVTLNDCIVLFWLQAMLDIFFYIRLYVAMHEGYASRHGDFVIEASKCRKRYYKHKLWVWSDFLVNTPFCMFAFCCPNPVRLMHYFRINKLFRVKYLFEFYHRTAAELTNNLTLLQLVMTTAVVVILIHTSSCIWLLCLIATSPVSVIRTMKISLIDEEYPLKTWDYTTSVYIVIAELTTSGGDEYFLGDLLPMLVLAVILISNKILAALVVATSIQVAYSTKYALSFYEKNTGILIDFLKNQGLSGYQLKKFWTYVQQLWITERGRQLPVLIHQTPYVRRCDVMSAMFGHYLANCYLFADTGEAFLRQLSVLLDYTIFFPGNYIVVAGDSEARMYWVASGVVSVVSVRSDLTETTHELLEQGDIFGIMQGLNRGIAHNFSYRAETKVSILTLSLDSWVDILPFFPEAKRIIEERSEVLFTQI